MKVQKQVSKKSNCFKRGWFSFKNWIKSWSPYAKNKTINCLTYILGLFIILGINYCVMFGAFVPKFFIVDILIMVVSIAPIFFCRGTMFDRIWMTVLMIIVTVFITVNVNYYKFFKVVFSLKDWKMAFDNIGQAGAHASELYWSMIITNVIICVVFLAWIWLFNIKFRFKENKNCHKTPSRRKINIFASTFLVGSIVSYEFAMGMWTIYQKNIGVDSIKYVDYSPSYHFENLGMASYYNRAVRAEVLDKGVSDKDIAAYLSNQVKVQDKYTGVLDQPNVFVIMVETGDRLMVNEYTTPNLWKIFRQEGVYGEHNFSYNHSNITNTIAVTGCYPMNALNQTHSFNVPFCLPQILKKLDYRSRFYYDTLASEDGYHDMPFMESLGFEKSCYHEDFIPYLPAWKYGQDSYNRDTLVAEGLLNDLTNAGITSGNNKFYCQWMTMLMHLNNNVVSTTKELFEGLHNDYGPKLKQLEAEGKWTNPIPESASDARERFENWTLKTMDFDKALGMVFDYLYGPNAPEERKNTILVAFGDHSWYEIADGKEMAKWGKGIDDRENINLYKTVLGFYHPKLQALIDNDKTKLFNSHDLNRMTTPACIVPTVLDLMGIPYNRGIYQDRSIFDLSGHIKYNSSLDEIYYSSWLGMYMNEHYTSNNGSFITKVVDANNTREEFNAKVKEKIKQLRIIDSIYHKDFFDRYNYEDFLPTSTIANNYCQEYALVKQY